MVEASMRGAWGIDLRGYLGARDSSRVLGWWKLVLFLMARFLFAYDCHLVNCVRHTRRTARQRLVLARLKKFKGFLHHEGQP
jgi:hypothetical protein